MVVNASAPTDNNYGGYEVGYTYQGEYTPLDSGKTFPYTGYHPMPSQIESRLYTVRGIEAGSGRRNTIVVGVTPAQTVSVGSNTGMLDLGKSASGTYGPQMTVDANGRLNVATGSLGQSFMATGLRVPEIVSALPASFTNYPAGSMVALISNSIVKVYRSTGTTWTAAVDGGDIVANTITAGAIAAGAIGTVALAAQYIDIGGAGNKCPRLAIRSGTGILIGWFGDDTATANNPGGSGFIGWWMQNRRFGGTSPSNANAIWDSSGNLTITFTQNGITTKLGNFYDSYQTAYCGMQVADSSNSSSLLAGQLVIYRTPTPGNSVSAFVGRLLSGGSVSVAHDNGSYNAVIAANNSGFGVARAFVELNSSRGACGLYANSTSSYLQIDGTQGYTGSIPATATLTVKGGIITSYS